MAHLVDGKSKHEKKERREKATLLQKTLRRLAVGSSWRFSGGTLFREYAGWFVEVESSVWASARRTTAHLRIKPMAMDPLFWDIVGLPENRKLPLSFRALGAWTCRAPVLKESDFDEVTLGPELLAQKILAWADEQLLDIAKLGSQDFLNFLRGAPRGYVGAYLAVEVTALMLSGKDQEAYALCEEARKRGDSGGFSVAAKSVTFVSLATNWLERRSHKHDDAMIS